MASFDGIPDDILAGADECVRRLVGGGVEPHVDEGFQVLRLDELHHSIRLVASFDDHVLKGNHDDYD